MKKSIKKLASLLLAGTLVLGLVGCGNSDENTNDAKETETTTGTTTETTEELTPVRLGIVGSQDTCIIMEFAALAFNGGYFEEELNKEGYTIDAKYFAGAGPEINEALASKEVDVAVYGDLPVFVSNSNGISSTIIANVNSGIKYSMITNNDSITKPSDLEGKNVVVGIGTIAQYFWESYVAYNNLDISKINVVNSTDGATLLSTGDADVMVGADYTYQTLKAAGDFKAFDTSDNIEGGVSSEVVSVRNEYLEENPKVAVAINRALIRAYDDAKDDPQLLYDAADSNNITADMWKAVYEDDFSKMAPEISDEQIAYFKEFNQWLLDNGLITESVDVDTLYDTSYYEQAVEELE